MKIVFFLFFYLVFIINIFTQDIYFKRNSIYCEFFGNGGSLISLNYERLVSIDNVGLSHIGFREGFSFKDNYYDSSKVFIFPIELNYILGEKSHRVEFGIGTTLNFGTSNFQNPNLPVGYKSNFQYMLTFRIGYRFYDSDRMLVRFAPLLTFEQVTPPSQYLRLGWTVGASIGFCFDSKKSESKLKK